MHFIKELETDLFVVAWDGYPATPGHALIIPRRHGQYMKDLSPEVQRSLIPHAIITKQFIRQTDLLSTYEQMVTAVTDSKSEVFIAQAIHTLKKTNREPDAFNDGLNDGFAAGQTMPHFHWHIMPRWDGDASDPRGGIRHMFPGMGNYRDGMATASTLE